MNPLFGVGSSSAHPGHGEGHPLVWAIATPCLIPPREMSPSQLSPSWDEPLLTGNMLEELEAAQQHLQGFGKCHIRVSL